MDSGELAGLLGSYTLHLRGERKSAQTIKSYTIGVRLFLAWCDREGIDPALDRPTVDKWIASLLDDGAEAATARSRQLAVRRFSAWLAEEGEIPADLLAHMSPPKLDVKAVPVLDGDQLKAMIAACKGPRMMDKRDEALIRFMAETGARAGEVLALQLGDVNLQAGTAVIHRGKGGKARTVPFGPRTGAAIDRYIRARRHHRLASGPALWLGDRGKGLAYYGLRCALADRAKAAGIEGFHPHMMRHTAADRWLSAGGSEGGLMAVAGWTRPDMLHALHPRPRRAARRRGSAEPEPRGPVRILCPRGHRVAEVTWEDGRWTIETVSDTSLRLVDGRVVPVPRYPAREPLAAREWRMLGRTETACRCPHPRLPANGVLDSAAHSPVRGMRRTMT